MLRFITVFLLAVSTAIACTCAAPAPLCQALPDLSATGVAIFVGTVTAVDHATSIRELLGNAVPRNATFDQEKQALLRLLGGLL